MRRCGWRSLGVAFVLLAWPAVRLAHAEAYVIGPEDVLQVSVWMHPELERAVTVGADSTITFPPVGVLKAAGLTADDLALRLSDRLSSYLRQTATVTVSVTQYLSHGIYVSGAVAHPGRFGFERVPGVLDVINSAGGAVAGADLSQVQIIRHDGGLRRPQIVDVARALREGSEASLPELHPGDTVVVPAGLALGAPSTGDAAGVLGEVSHPGLYPIGGGQDLWIVLAAAGGTTGRANLGDVRILRRKETGTVVYSVNLKEQLRRGARDPFVVQIGDVVVVPGGSSWSTTWSGLTQFLALSRDIANIVLIGDYLKRNTH